MTVNQKLNLILAFLVQYPTRNNVNPHTIHTDVFDGAITMDEARQLFQRVLESGKVRVLGGRYLQSAMDTEEFLRAGGFEGKKSLREELLKLLLSSPDGVLLNDLINSFSAINPNARTEVSYFLRDWEAEKLLTASFNYGRLQIRSEPFDFDVRARLTTKGIREARDVLQALNPDMRSQIQSAGDTIHIQVGDNSPLQFQHKSPGAMQSIQRGEVTNEQLMAAVQEIKAKLDELSAHLPADDLATLQSDTEHLEGALNRPAPNLKIVRALWESIQDILKSIPGNVIANIVSSGLPLS